MLGAGGAARAIGLGLVRADAALTITNRSGERAKELAGEIGCQHIKWEHRGTGYYDILVNCTPVGMHPEVDETPFPNNFLREGMIVFDTVYNPETTLLIKEARERNCTTVSGIEMFVRQAAVQYELFTGQSAPMDKMREAIREGISAIRPY
jgi:3-dehydroquinate dehydratase/shikimate dehydrogenase